MTARLTQLVELSPVSNTNLHDQVYAQLRQVIMAGRFPPGEVLTLRSLALALGTSVMPARDAVLRLTSEHALERVGRGVRLPLLDRSRLEDIWRFRVALEGEAASLAAKRATEEQIASVVQAADEVELAQRRGEINAFLAANQAFHFSVYKGADSALLQGLIETLWLQIGPYLGLTARAQTGNVAIVDLGCHRRIVSALQAHSPDAARDALRQDLEDSTDVFGALDAYEAASIALSPQRARQMRT